MNKIDEYILQKFPSNRNGRLETNLAYKCRLYWIRSDYPTAKEVALACGTTPKTVSNYKEYYNWNKIQEKIEVLKEKENQEKFSKYQVDTLKNIQEINKQRTGVLIYRLDFLSKEVGASANETPNPNLSRKTIDDYWQEIYKIIKLLSEVQKDRLRDAGLPTHIQDKLQAQVHSVSAINLITGKSKEELDKEYEDTIKKYIRERIGEEE